MRVFASILVVLGLLVTLGGIAGLMAGNPTAPIRLGVGIVIVIIAFAIRPKPAPKPPERVPPTKR